MHWLICSSQPARLHALLESAAMYMRSVAPVVFVRDDISADAHAGYQLLSQRFRCGFESYGHSRTLSAAITEVLSRPRSNGTLDPMVMLSHESCLFVSTVNPSDAWRSLVDQSILGVSLFLSPYLEWSPASPLYFRQAPFGLHSWIWSDSSDPWGLPFSWGTIYRSGDLLGPLSESPAIAPAGLHLHLNGQRDWAVRRRMACFAQSFLRDQPTELDGLSEYLDGLVLSHEDLKEGRVRWIRQLCG